MADGSHYVDLSEIQPAVTYDRSKQSTASTIPRRDNRYATEKGQGSPMGNSGVCWLALFGTLILAIACIVLFMLFSQTNARIKELEEHIEAFAASPKPSGDEGNELIMNVTTAVTDASDGNHKTEPATTASLLATTASIGNLASCPTAEGTTLRIFSNKCYYIRQDPTLIDFHAADQFCRDRRPALNLLEIESQEEQDWIESIAKEQGMNHLGTSGIREGRTTRFVWSSGAPMVYENWRPDEPNDYGDGEQCLVLSSGNDYQWNDIGCNFKMRVICEYP